MKLSEWVYRSAQAVGLVPSLEDLYKAELARCDKEIAKLEAVLADLDREEQELKNREKRCAGH